MKKLICCLLLGEDAIELINEHRNDLIEKLSHVEFLKSYLQRGYIWRALLELKSSPLDLTYYA